MAKMELSPRQKMINLIYVILLAMLAINVSDDVMKGYTVLNNEYGTRNSLWQETNENLLTQLKSLGVDSLYQKGVILDKQTKDIISFTKTLKEQIAAEADKDDYEKGKLQNDEDLKSVPYIMLAPTQRNGTKLRKQMDAYRNFLGGIMKDSINKSIAMAYVSTNAVRNRIGTSFSWERECFNSLPAIGGIVLLNRIEENVLFAERECLRDLLLQVVKAVYKKGGNIPTSILTSASGVNSPMLTATSSESSSDIPVETGEISDLYSGIGNTLNLFPGTPVSQLQMTTNNGHVALQKGKWVIIPQNPERKADVTVRHRPDGRVLGKFSFNVKSIPDPTPYIILGESTYRGGVPVSKAKLNTLRRLGATYRHGKDNIEFRIISFETVFVKANGKIERMNSHGGSFSPAQQAQIKMLNSGDRFYVTSIIVEDNGGNRREIEPLNIIID